MLGWILIYQNWVITSDPFSRSHPRPVPLTVRVKALRMSSDILSENSCFEKIVCTSHRILSARTLNIIDLLVYLMKDFCEFPVSFNYIYNIFDTICKYVHQFYSKLLARNERIEMELSSKLLKTRSIAKHNICSAMILILTLLLICRPQQTTLYPKALMKWQNRLPWTTA